MVNIISGLFIIVPAFAAFSRLKTLRPSFLPLLLILSSGFCNELTGLILIYKTGNNTALYNIYGLIYGILILWQFRRWNIERFNAPLLWWCTFTFVGIWSISFFAGGVHGDYTFFLLTRDACIVAFSYRALYIRMREVQSYIYKDPIALISAGWLLLFIYDCITELLLVYGGNPKEPAFFFVQPLFSIVNILVQITHLYAILCIPPKTRC